GPQEAVEGFSRSADDRFVLVERCVEDHRYAREGAKTLDQAVISRVGSLSHRLQPAGAVDVGNSGDELPFLLADLEHLHHEGDGIIFFDPSGHSLLEHRWSERAK